MYVWCMMTNVSHDASTCSGEGGSHLSGKRRLNQGSQAIIPSSGTIKSCSLQLAPWCIVEKVLLHILAQHDIQKWWWRRKVNTLSLFLSHRHSLNTGQQLNSHPCDLFCARSFLVVLLHCSLPQSRPVVLNHYWVTDPLTLWSKLWTLSPEIFTQIQLYMQIKSWRSGLSAVAGCVCFMQWKDELSFISFSGKLFIGTKGRDV